VCSNNIFVTHAKSTRINKALAVYGNRMKLTFNDLTVNFSHLKLETILSDWVWLIGKNKLPILITAFGEPFVQDRKSGSVYFLSVADADLTKVADSPEEFKEKLNDDEFTKEYFPTQAVGDLKESGSVLNAGQVYSYKVPPMLGGEFVPENIEPCDISVHFSILGQIHEQVKDLPEGAEIGEIKLKSSKPWWKFWG